MEVDSSLKIRRATKRDSVEITRLCTQLGYPSSEILMQDRLERLIESPVHVVLVAHEGDVVLGWLSGEERITLESGTRVEITGLIVDSTVRRAGIGKRLVSRLEQWALDRRCSEVSVRSNVARLESHPFYEGLRYARTKTQHAYRKALNAL